ncbi:MAG: DNA sulfur modification protein DndE [Kiritimatiellia bacterium]
MKPPIETVRVSTTARERLIKMKRTTGIEHWNELCRWALCLALASKQKHVHSPPADKSNVEMSWATFAGEYSTILTAAVKLKWQAARTQNPKLTLADFFSESLNTASRSSLKAVQKARSRHICGLPFAQ